MAGRAHRGVVAAAAVLLSVLLAGCGGDDLTPESDTFAGVDPAVVAEVRESPVAWGKVEQEDEATRASLAQGIARNFVQCRAAFGAYESWVTTGQTPPVPELPSVTHPLEPGNSALESDHAFVEAAIASGEPGKLRDFLVGEARCGEWIPAEPGAVDGPTIEDAVEELG